MPIKKPPKDTIFCKYCGTKISQDAQFCKKCGKSFQEENSLIFRINSKINLFSVLLGLIVTLIIFFIGIGFLGMVIVNGMDVLLYLFLILFAMLFFGGLTTGILGSNTIKGGLINGGTLSIITFLILGFIVGILAFISIGLAASIASAFSGIGTTSAATAAASNLTVPNLSNSLDAIFFLIQIILTLIISFLAGFGGGAVGAWIKGGRL